MGIQMVMLWMKNEWLKGGNGMFYIVPMGRLWGHLASIGRFLTSCEFGVFHF